MNNEHKCLYRRRCRICNLPYKKALEFCKNGSYITRQCWCGVHFIKDGVYKILTEDKGVVENPEVIEGMDEDDWCVVEITVEGRHAIEMAEADKENQEEDEE